MKVRTGITLLVVAAFALAIVGHFLPQSHVARDPMWREVCELSDILRRFCGGAMWHTAAIGVLIWHLIGDISPGKGRDH